MDEMEKWGILVDCYNENKTVPEKKIQEDWENLFVEIFGYSKLSKEVDAQRNIQIGATVRTIPDIIIHDKEQGDLFVVELKQHTILTGYEQLFSYLKLLKVDIGILICNKLYIYDYDTDKDDDNQSVLEIEFTKDNPDGIKFVELFSKGSFDKENIKKFIRERQQMKNNIQAIQEQINQTLIYKVLKEHFTTHFSEGEFNVAVKDMKILIEKEKSMQNTTMVTTGTVHLPPHNSDDPYPNMKIGEIANQILRNRLSKGISEQELMNLRNAEYSKQFLGVNYPVLAESRYVKDKNGNPHSRYYATQVKINNRLFFLCSEWYETPANNDRPYLINWLKTHQ